MKEKKQNGKVFTPGFIVKNVLDACGYEGEKILKKHAIDPSCGDGAFLCEIALRYCKQAVSLGLSKDEIADDLATFIHGVELNSSECENAVANLNRAVSKFNLGEITWDITCENALCVEKYGALMYFVVGNPPYVRVHNFADNFSLIKSFSFSQSGMSDLFIVFYELGLRMLNKNGILSFISPSSFFSSLAGQKMREVLVERNLIYKIIDLGHFQPFKDATTYTAIAVLKNDNASKKVKFYRYDERNLKPVSVCDLGADEFLIDGKFCFAKRDELGVLRRILNNEKTSDIAVKNGFATLCDGVFINDFKCESKFVIDAVKASKGVCRKIFYPYDKNGKILTEKELRNDEIWDYLIKNKARLEARAMSDKEPFYAFGRTQAIKDTYKDKLAINTLIRDENDLKFSFVKSGAGVYGGLYVTSLKTPLEKIRDALKSREFASFIKLLGKYKSGGYYTFSSKDVKAFLDFKFGEKR